LLAAGLLVVWLLVSYLIIPYAWKRYARLHFSFDDNLSVWTEGGFGLRTAGGGQPTAPAPRPVLEDGLDEDGQILASEFSAYRKTLSSHCVSTLTTGRVLRGPATLALATYEVREQDGEIQVRV
jgi:hypothetical protein